MAIDWFVVTCEDEAIHLSVRPPGQDSWSVDIPWEAIVRVCFKAEDLDASDGLYVFTDLGEESVAIPTEAVGGAELFGELVRRGAVRRRAGHHRVVGHHRPVLLAARLIRRR